MFPEVERCASLALASWIFSAMCRCTSLARSTGTFTGSSIPSSNRCDTTSPLTVHCDELSEFSTTLSETARRASLITNLVSAVRNVPEVRTTTISLLGCSACVLATSSVVSGAGLLSASVACTACSVPSAGFSSSGLASGLASALSADCSSGLPSGFSSGFSSDLSAGCSAGFSPDPSAGNRGSLGAVDCCASAASPAAAGGATGAASSAGLPGASASLDSWFTATAIGACAGCFFRTKTSVS
mmetsp:Transcript_107868/g.287187  ORF Transcript_107868/g.287187 Transcript_107868/m.287187 type:complete len:243 (+) Transcript_107868:364-1092(+)